jgi:hypothetical protein
MNLGKSLFLALMLLTARTDLALAEVLRLQCDVRPKDDWFRGKLMIDTGARRATIDDGKPFSIDVDGDLISGDTDDGEILLFYTRKLQGSLETMGGAFTIRNCKRR